MSELERCFDVLGFKFLKVYPDYLGKPIDDPDHASPRSPKNQYVINRRKKLLIRKHSKSSSRAI